jgi:hypothetical protein
MLMRKRTVMKRQWRRVRRFAVSREGRWIEPMNGHPGSVPLSPQSSKFLGEMYKRSDMKITLLWVVKTRSLVYMYERLEITCCLQFQDRRYLYCEDGSGKFLRNIYQSIGDNIPDYRNLHSYRSKNLKSHTVSYISCSKWSKQGDALSPLLFNFVLKYATNRIRIHNGNRNTQGEHTGHQKYIMRSRRLRTKY